MLNIDEKQLQLLLERRRRLIEKPKYGGIADVVSGLSLAVTISLSDFSQITFTKPLYFKCIVWALTCGILVYGVFSLIKSITTFYSIENLYGELSDLDFKIEHPFNIVVIRNTYENGKYLTFKSRRWKCWLFPNYHCLNENFSKTKEAKHIKECINRDINITEDSCVKYIGNEIVTKFSVGDQIEKRYNFHYFEVNNIGVIFNNRQTFRCNGKRYCWKTLDQMYSNKNIVKKNKNVLDFVRHHCDIS